MVKLQSQKEKKKKKSMPSQEQIDPGTRHATRNIPDSLQGIPKHLYFELY